MSSLGGRTGPAGATGATGATGAQGPAGATGATGATGAAATVTTAAAAVTADTGVLTASAYTDLTGATITATLPAGNMRCHFEGMGLAGGASGSAFMAILVDGVVVAEAVDIMASTLAHHWSITKVVSVSAGSHTIKVQFKMGVTPSATTRINPASTHYGRLDIAYPFS